MSRSGRVLFRFLDGEWIQRDRVTQTLGVLGIHTQYIGSSRLEASDIEMGQGTVKLGHYTIMVIILGLQHERLGKAAVVTSHATNLERDKKCILAMPHYNTTRVSHPWWSLSRKTLAFKKEIPLNSAYYCLMKVEHSPASHSKFPCWPTARKLMNQLVLVQIWAPSLPQRMWLSGFQTSSSWQNQECQLAPSERCKDPFVCQSSFWPSTSVSRNLTRSEERIPQWTSYWWTWICHEAYPPIHPRHWIATRNLWNQWDWKWPHKRSEQFHREPRQKPEPDRVCSKEHLVV